MPTLQSVMPTTPPSYEPPKELKQFIVRPPEGVELDSIKGWITGLDGRGVEFVSDSLDSIVMDINDISSARSFTIVAYEMGISVAQYTGVAMDLEILDIINLRPVAEGE
ncbi:MAG: hypothetical protein P0S96_04605 [Simkaniaceae bacterium]|nr:hypothetical protein [Candidatus Sacchlamyda saccharinae]